MKTISLFSPQLEAFMAVSEYKTVHAAAKALHLTQTAVSQRLQSLENKLKSNLFIRTRKGMELTQEGEILHRYCLTAQEMQGKTIAGILGVGKDIEIVINISGPTSLMRTRVISQTMPMTRHFNKLSFYFNINDQADNHLLLKRGKCQLAILPHEALEADMEHKVLEPEQYILVCSEKWHDRKLEAILAEECIIDFDPSDQLTLNYLKHFDLLSYAKHQRYFVNNTETLTQLLIQGYGYGLLTKESSEAYIHDKQLIVLNDEQYYENQLALAWYSRPNMPKYMSAIIDAIN